MPSWRSVLCPVDYSDNSRRALCWAGALAARQRARLRVIYVTDTMLATAAGSLGLDPLDEVARRELEEFVAAALPARLRWRPPITVELRVGTPHEEILSSARDDGSDLIVMGTRGWSGYRKLLFGSTTERILREARVPVLAVPLAERERLAIDEHAPVFDLRSVVAAVDLREGSDAFLDYAIRVAGVFGVRLLLVHVVAERHAPPRWQAALEAQARIARARAAQQLDALASHAGARGGLETIVELGPPAEQISAIAAEHDSGLIVLGLRGGPGLLAPSPGSVAYRVLGLAKVPVLMVPPTPGVIRPPRDADAR